MISREYRQPLALIGLAALWGIGAAHLACASPQDPANVVIKDFLFGPKSLTIKVGAAVTWVNLDDEPHNIVSDEGLFRSGGLDTNETFSHKFDRPGTYHLTCSIHPRMIATIVVE